jgi:ankyrin repeat protein
VWLVTACLVCGGVGVVLFSFRDRRPAIYFAAQNADVGALTKYLAAGNDVNTLVPDYPSVRRSGAPLLSIAASNGHSNVVSFLLSKGANPNLFDSSGDPPLHWVMSREWDANSRQVVELLLQAGANPTLHYTSEYHYTPLMTAAAAGQAEMVKMLLSAGADVRATNTIGQTALHLAHGHADIARLLLASGADAGARDLQGDTPTDCARRYGDTNTIAILTRGTGDY